MNLIIVLMVFRNFKSDCMKNFTFRSQQSWSLCRRIFCIYLCTFHLSYFHQVPDFLNARINGLPVKEVIKDTKWLEEDFTEIVQKVRSHIMVNDFVFSVLDGVISDYLW